MKVVINNPAWTEYYSKPVATLIRMSQLPIPTDKLKKNSVSVMIHLPIKMAAAASLAVTEMRQLRPHAHPPYIRHHCQPLFRQGYRENREVGTSLRVI